MNKQIDYIQDSFLLYGICSNTECDMGQSSFSTLDYTRCPNCDEPAQLPYSLSPVLGKKQSTRNVFKRYFPDYVNNLFGDMSNKGDSIGNTPLSENNKVSKWTGVKTFLKEEGNNPSGSFKDRGSFMALCLLRGYAEKLGLEADFIFGTVSTGNMAISSAFWANKTGYKSFIVVSNQLSQKKLDAIQHAGGVGTNLFVIDGDYQNIHDIVYRTCTNLRQHNVAIFPQLTDDVFRISGYATLFAEIIEQLLDKKSFPDVIVLPVASGALFRAAIWAVESLYSKGYIKKIPRLVLVQEIGGGPIIHALENHLDKIEKISVVPTTIASGIAVAYSRSGNPILKILKEGYHIGMGVTAQEIQDAKAILHAQNYFAEEASCASLAAAKKLRHLGKISPEDTAVCVLTGEDIHCRHLPETNNSQTIYCTLDEFGKKLAETYKGRSLSRQ